MNRHPLEEESHKVCRRHQIVARFRAHVAGEDGNVESALVIIPLMILFLIGAQIIAATNIRNADLAMAQGDAAARAIFKSFIPTMKLLRSAAELKRSAFW